MNRITKLKVHKKRFEQQYKLTRSYRHLLHTTYNNMMQIILNYIWKILHKDHMLGHKTSLNKFKGIEVLQSIISNHIELK